MISFFYEVVKRAKKHNFPYWKLLYKVNKVLVNLFFPLTRRWRKTWGVDSESRIIISLTTYPARIDGVWITIASLLEQSMKPGKVILWLAKDQFPEGKVPHSLKRMEKRGLEIQFCDDLKPHKKYFEAVRKYPDYYVITADDDVLYPKDHIKQLWTGLEKYPNSVICHWSHKIEFSSKEEFKPYNDWPDNGEEEPSYLTLAVGCNGILYPPGCLPPETFQQQKIRKYALDTDDLWLKCMEVLNGWKVVNCNRTILVYFNRLSTRKTGLWKSNTGEGRNNDKNWIQLMEQYPEVKILLMQEMLSNELP